MAALAALAAIMLVLTGCAGAPEGGASGEGSAKRVQIVASTNVYGQIAEQIGGDRVDVTSIISSGSQDPHSYEATARDQLAISRAQLVIENGGGFDAFIARLIAAAGTDPVLITAVNFAEDAPDSHEGDGHEADADVHAADAHGADAHDADVHDADDAHAHDADAHDADGHDTGTHDADAHDADAHDADAQDADAHDEAAHDHDNEHVWFDPAAMSRLGAQLAADLAALVPEGAGEFARNAADFALELEAVQGEIARIGAEHAGEGVFLSEPLAAALAAETGLVDVTPEGFAAAVEAGRDVSPSVLLASLRVIEGGEARVVFVNAQTAGAETKRIMDAATAANIPILAFTETIPEGSAGARTASYPEWMADNVARLAAALAEGAPTPAAATASAAAATDPTAEQPAATDTGTGTGAGSGAGTAVAA